LACDMSSCKLKPDMENLLTAERPGNKFNFFVFLCVSAVQTYYFSR
jgi:hypothetical protein